MKTIWIVYIQFIPPSASPYINNYGIDKPYAVCTKKEEADHIKNLLNDQGEKGLRALKILKQDEEFKCAYTYSYMADNTKAIIQKLSKLEKNEVTY